VHNAFLMFRRSAPFLDYYLHLAQQLVREHVDPMVTQFVDETNLISDFGFKN